MPPFIDRYYVTVIILASPIIVNRHTLVIPTTTEFPVLPSMRGTLISLLRGLRNLTKAKEDRDYDSGDNLHNLTLNTSGELLMNRGVRHAVTHSLFDSY